MNHHELRELLSAYRDGEAAKNERSLLEEHLVHCEECARLMHGWAELGSKMKSIEGVQLPVGFSRRVLNNIRQEEEDTSFWMPVEALARKTVLGLSMAVILLVVFMLVTEPAQPVIIESYLSGEVQDGNAPSSLLQRESISKDDVLLAVMTK